jgi:hypothetical protein
LEIQSLLIGLTIGYIGCLIACWFDRKSILDAFMSEFVVFVEDDDE